MSQLAVASAARSATRWRDQTIINLLEKLGRERELKPEESAMMERTVRRLKPKRNVWRWSEAEDRAIHLLIAKRPIRVRYVDYGKPFERNDEVRKMAELFGRTEWAVYRRMERLRKRDKCSKAARKGKG